MADQERLALYLMGALDDAERESFEAHLADCWHCLDEAAQIGPSISGLAGLDDVDWSLPTDEFPPPVAATDAASPSADSSSGSPPASSSPAVADDSAVSRPSGSPSGAGAARPADNRPASRRTSGARPATTGGSWRRRRALWAGAAAVILVLAGGVVVVNEWTARTDPVLTATGDAPGHGASLSVVITPGGQGSATIRITATGLRQGTRYRLFAVTRDGATHVVRDWTATSGPQEVAGETSLPVDELSFITVGLTDGSAIVTAPIARTPASPR
ncbi:zf-HC2 domain-containing protein [Micromonospora sp. NPDC048871]|uniref:zf-HC2 domain-containing protein n=1 Tax=unclassified Micromonospora TaxID=2617518 RepID=UPI002E14B216|nr:zf-HC2 domain-containing protein [Micromonospora sp. NBC_01739]